jgi:hypothetical protein
MGRYTEASFNLLFKLSFLYLRNEKHTRVEQTSAMTRPTQIAGQILAHLITLADFVSNTINPEPKYPHTIRVTASRSFLLPYLKLCFPVSFTTEHNPLPKVIVIAALTPLLRAPA